MLPPAPQHVQEMIDAFPKLKREAMECEIVLASGWTASYKRRRNSNSAGGAGGDVYLTRPGEPALRSAADVKRLRSSCATASCAGSIASLAEADADEGSRGSKPRASSWMKNHHIIDAHGA